MTFLLRNMAVDPLIILTQVIEVLQHRLKNREGNIFSSVRWYACGTDARKRSSQRARSEDGEKEARYDKLRKREK